MPLRASSLSRHHTSAMSVQLLHHVAAQGTKGLNSCRVLEVVDGRGPPSASKFGVRYKEPERYHADLGLRWWARSTHDLQSPKGAPKAPQLGAGSVQTGQPAEGSKIDDQPSSGPRTGPSHAPVQPRCCTAGGRRELLRSAMLQPHAAAWQPSKRGAKATSGSPLPPTECTRSAA